MSVTNSYNGASVAGYPRCDSSSELTGAVASSTVSSLTSDSGGIELNHSSATVQPGSLHSHSSVAQQLLRSAEQYLSGQSLPEAAQSFDQRLFAEWRETNTPSRRDVDIQEGRRSLQLPMEKETLFVGQCVLHALLAKPDCSANLGDIAGYMQKNSEHFCSADRETLMNTIEHAARNEPSIFHLLKEQDSRESTVVSLTRGIMCYFHLIPPGI